MDAAILSARCLEGFPRLPSARMWESSPPPRLWQSGILLVAGLIPKFSSVLLTIPNCVLGGATVSVFASIAMTGVKLITAAPMDYRNTTIVGLSVALGMGITQANGALASFPAWVTTIFGKSPVVLATITAIILNLVLPGRKREAAAG